MNLLRIILLSLLLAPLVGGTAQAQNTGNVFVFMVGKLEAQHVVLTPIMEVDAAIERDALIATFQKEYPQITDASRFEGLRFTTREEAEKELAQLKDRYAAAGRKVDLLGAAR